MRAKRGKKRQDRGKEGRRDARGEAETLPVNNIYALMVVLFILSSVFSSYLTYIKSRDVVQELTGEVSAEAKVCINKGPSIGQNCSTTATVGVGYYCDVDASDPDNDTLLFSDNSGLFSIDANTGEIIFTPAAGDAGVHNIVVTVSDGKVCDNSEVNSSFTLTIQGVPGPPPGPGGGGGGGGGGECTPQWECTPWAPCRSDGTTTRTCYSLNRCFRDKPVETEGCIYVMPITPRKRIYPEYYLCNFDMVDECTESFGLREDWVYTYKQKNSTINIIGITQQGVDASIDDSLLLYAPLDRIKGVDVDGDDSFDFEYILHRIEHGRAVMTVRIIKKIEIVREKPIYVPGLPPPLPQILEFVYENACQVFLIVLILAAMLLYIEVMKRVDEEDQRRKKKSHKK
jgi:hypothetical protein